MTDRRSCPSRRRRAAPCPAADRRCRHSTTRRTAGPIGHPIHCSFHQILSMRLSWQPAARHRDLVEVREEEQAAERVLAAGRRAVEPDARDVVGRILRRHRLVPEDAIGEAGVLDVLPRDVVEGLRAVARPHAVDLHDDEPDFGLRLHLVERGERLRHERALRPGVDVLDDRILLRRDRSSSGGR